jgi:hypothetical protein
MIQKKRIQVYFAKLDQLENREELDVMIKFFSNMATDMIEN